MKSRTLFSTTALFLLAAGATIGGSQAVETQTQSVKLQQARVCHDTRCEARVTVSGCTVTVEPYFLVMVPQPDKARPGSFHPIRVTWTISGGTFAEKDPIYWKDYGARHVFNSAELAKDRKSITFSNSGARGIYHYGVRALDAKGQPCAELDPTGINDPP